MLKLSIPQLSDKILFGAALELTASAMDRLKKRKDMNEGELAIFRGKRNEIAVGTPYYENLTSRLIEEEKEIPYKIRKMIDDYDFHFISLSCSFSPDTDCRFVWARFGVELSAQSESGEQENPIAHDMFPDEVLTKMKCRRKVFLDPELKLSLDVIDTDAVIDVKTEKELTVYVPQILAFGINMPNVTWDFKSTEEKGIWGNKRDLLLVVRAPKHSKIKGRFLLGAEVEFNIGKWVQIPLSKRKDKVVDREYDLSN